jgi:hypothetical protein
VTVFLAEIGYVRAGSFKDPQARARRVSAA